MAALSISEIPSESQHFVRHDTPAASLPESTVLNGGTGILRYKLPDFIAPHPYILRKNPHYEPIARESEDWLHSYGVHPNQAHRRAFQDCDFGRLTAYCYADADRTQFRVLCDFINCLFAFDDLTDEGGLRKDSGGARKASDIVMNALHHPFTFETTFRIGQVIRSFWSRAILTGASEGTQRRFLEYTDLYVAAVHEQVVNRAKDKILPIKEFVRLRRDTGALKMCFAMGEYAWGLDLPDEVFEHPLIKVMEDCANDVVVLSNDVYSYNIEQAQGDTCNIIEVAMKENNLDVQGAITYAGQLVLEQVSIYVSSKAQLPVWGEKIDDDVQKYLQVCEDWMTAGFYWSLESKRYFGENVEEVKRTLWVEVQQELAPRGQAVIPDL